MGKIAFTTDKKKVNVGEYFTVCWECRNPDMVTLSVQDGGKTVYQQKALRDIGLNEISLGVESGDDWTLRRINKGYTSADILEQCNRLGIPIFRYNTRAGRALLLSRSVVS